MLEETRIKLIGAGLILAIVVIGVLIFSQKFASTKTEDLNLRTVVQSSPLPSSSPAAAITPSPVVKGTQTATLPKTGFPVGLFAILSASAAIAGFGLRKFPN